MLSRASQLTRLNAAYILRQLSVSPSSLSKQAHLSQKESHDESNQTATSSSSSSTTTTTTQTTATSGGFSTTGSKDIKSATRTTPTGSNYRGANSNDQSRENWRPLKDIKSEIKRIKNFTNNRTTLGDKTASFKSEKYNSVKETRSDSSRNEVVYNQIVTQISTCQDLPQLIDACQKLNNLNDTDAETAAKFRKDTSKKTKVSKALLSHIEEMDLKSILTTVQFICRFDEASFDDLKPIIYHNIDKFTFEQLTKIIAALRTVVFYKPNASDTLREIRDHARSQIESKLDSLADAKRALRTFTSDSDVVARIDLRISQLADKLTLADWIDLFNTKSVLRQRNIALLEICAYNIMKLTNGDGTSSKLSLQLEHIQKCLLSCGILHYHELTFFKFLADQLRKQLDNGEEKLPATWMNENETCLLAIINSVGMLQLRDERMLDALGNVLKRHPDRKRLVVSFVQTCGALNYAPSTSFKQIVTSVGNDPLASGHFKLVDNDAVGVGGRERHSYLNFVWSLCLLNEASSYLVASVLEKKFFDSILKDKTSIDFKSNLLKILNINMHSMLRMDNYEGPNLPEDFQLAEYAEILAPKANLNEALVSALAGFRSVNKFVKLNLLTSFGILIDAFMIIDKNGAPLPLENYLGKESSSSDDEIRVAIKLIGYKDQTLINKQINGIQMFQLSLLKEIGYQPLIIYQNELQTASLGERVNLIEKKLIELARTKN